jgi:hypothetical protein
MKNLNVFLLTILIIVSGIIFASCPVDGGVNYCPQCRSRDIVYDSGYYRCNVCGYRFIANQ